MINGRRTKAITTMVRARTLAIAVLLMLSVAALASSAGASGESARGDLRRAVDAGMRERAEWRAWRASTEARAERERSRTAYEHLGDDAAADLIRTAHPDSVAPALSALGGRVEEYLDDHSARLRDGRVVDSMLPLRVTLASGKKVPLDLTIDNSGDAFAPTASLAPLRIGKRLEDGVSLQGGIGFSALLPNADTVGRVVGADVFYPNAGNAVDLAYKPLPYGVESFVLLRSPSATEDIAFRFSLPPGTALRNLGEMKGLSILQDGKQVGAVSNSIAIDAQGAPVPVTWRLVNDTLKVHVAHRNNDVSYPISLDPTVTDGFGWYVGETSNYGWNYVTGSAALTGNFQPYPYPGLGPGLYMQSPSPRTFNANDWSQWQYTAPGDSSVTTALFDVLDNNNSPNADTVCIAVELGGPVNQFANRCQDQFRGWSQTLTVTANPGNSAIYATNIGTSGLHQAITNHMGSSVLYLTDSKVPDVTSSSAPSGWTSNRGAVISASFSDSGLGVKQASLSGPSGWSGNQTVAGTGCVRVRCTGPATVSYTISNMFDGAHTVTATGTDVAGNPRSVSSNVQVDTTPPGTSISGDGWPASAGGAVPGTVGPGTHSVTVSANDPSSGVKTMTMKISPSDNAPDAEQSWTSTSCATTPHGGCSTSASHTFTYDANNYTNTPHTITIMTADDAGPTANTKTDTDPIVIANGNVLPRLPVASCSPSATAISGGYIGTTFVGLWSEQGPQSLKVCYQVGGTLGANQYGIIDVRTPATFVGTPTVDRGTCDNTVYSDSSDLTGQTLIGYTANVNGGSGFAVCVQTAGVMERLIWPITVSGNPQVTPGSIVPPPAPPAPRPWPSVPSAQCVNSGGTMLVDYQVLGVQTWIADSGSPTGGANLCARVEPGSGAGKGGVLSINATGGLPQVGTSTDLTPCTFRIRDIDNPVLLHLDSSPVISNPQSACVAAGPAGGPAVIGERVYAGNPGGTPVSFTPDPGTPQ